MKNYKQKIILIALTTIMMVGSLVVSVRIYYLTDGKPDSRDSKRNVSSLEPAYSPDGKFVVFFRLRKSSSDFG